MVTSADQVERLLTTINNTVVANVYGDLAVAVAQGFLTGLAFWVLQRALPHHVATAVASLVPVVGSPHSVGTGMYRPGGWRT